MANKRSKRPDVTCRICGQEMRRLTASHLRKHGLTAAQYRDKFDAPGMDFAPEYRQRNEILDSIAKWLIDDTPLKQFANRALDALMSEDSIQRYKVALHGIAQAKIARLSRLFSALDQIEQKLLDPVFIASLTTLDEMQAFKKMLDETINGTAAMAREIIALAKPIPGASVHFNTVVDARKVEMDVGFPVPEDPRKREQLRQVVMKLSKLAAKSQTTLPAPDQAQPVPSAPPEAPPPS